MKLNRIAFFVAAALVAGPASAQQVCTATPPIVKSLQVCYSFNDGRDCLSSPAAACDAHCGGKMQFPVPPLTQSQYCYLKATGPFAGRCGTFQLDTDTPVDTVATLVTSAKCATGFSSVNDQCVANTLQAEDISATESGGKINRDAAGNILSIEQPVGTVVETLGNYDAFGRPGTVNGLVLGWPADGSISPDALALGDSQIARLHWLDPAKVDRVTVGTVNYNLSYWPGGRLWTFGTDTGALIIRTLGWDQNGTPIPVFQPFRFPPPPPSVPAVPAPGSVPQVAVQQIATVPAGSIFQLGTITVDTTLVYPFVDSLATRISNWVGQCFNQAQQQTPTLEACKAGADLTYRRSIQLACRTITSAPERAQCFQQALQGYEDNLASCASQP